MKEQLFDYIIVGGGPCGLTCALYLSKQGKRCCIIDKNENLGGIHRVTRVNQLFTEHGPRIYSSAYVNFKTILSQLGTNFENLFVKYRFNISNVGGESSSHINLDEKMLIAWEYVKLTFGLNYKYLENTSVETFMKSKKFSPRAMDYIDRICRLTDGAGADRYSMLEFLQLINQNTFYHLYQPKNPNDKKLFFLWEQKLIQQGVQIFKNTEVLEYKSEYKNNDMHHLVSCSNNMQIKGEKVIFCIPPKPFVNLLEKNRSLLQSWSTYNKIDMREWALFNSYFNYIPITFHWRNKQTLPTVWGFPKEDWGVAFIVLSDYMIPNIDNPDFKNGMVISTCITRPDAVSRVTGKTAQQSNENDVKAEVFRQLRVSFPQIAPYDIALLHPKVKRCNNMWQEDDTAYIKTYKHEFVKYKVPELPGFYFVGTQNGNSFYNFTSLESAVTNALFYLRDEEKIRVSIERPFELVMFLRILLIIAVILLLYYKIIYKQYKQK